MRIKWWWSKRCNKRRFVSELDAQLALVRARRRRYTHTSTKVERRFYRCERCDGWHLTSEKKAS